MKVAIVISLLLATTIVSTYGQDGSCSSLGLIGAALNNITSYAIDEVSSRVRDDIEKLIHTIANYSNNTQQSIATLNANYQSLQTQVDDIDQRLQGFQTVQKQMTSQLTSIQTTLQQLLDKSSIHQDILNDISNNVDTVIDPLPHSCEDIKSTYTNASSGYYTIADSNGHTRQVYCYMNKDICDNGGGWTRIAMIDMTDDQEVCPEGFKLYSANGIRACGRPSSGCVSVMFPSEELTFSQVCGKVLGYEYGSPDGPVGSNINSAYIDGISLTHGYPRYHIWSFICGAYEDHHPSYCPCGSTGRKNAPSFVGSDYYCESGNPTNRQPSVLYTGDKLWDGEDCGRVEQACCNRAGMPWFHKTLGYTTTDYIELRVCGNEGNNNEDTPFSYVELYVK